MLVALDDAARRFPIPVAAFGEIVDGCVADVQGTSYATFDELLHYCRCVAGLVGRLSLGVFGAADQAEAAPLADALGVALQLTNILRDIREDYQNGRVYLPAEDLGRFGCSLDSLAGWAACPPSRRERLAATACNARRAAGAPPARARARAAGPAGGFEADRARSWYATGLRLLPMLDRRSAACGRDGRHLPAAARADRGGPGRGAEGQDVAVRRREGHGGRPVTGRHGGPAEAAPGVTRERA